MATCTIVSSNISAKDLTAPKFAENLLADINSAGIDAKNIKLEITESAALKLSKKALRAVAGLKAAGVSLSIDDFGTGNATFENLKNLPFDTLKIDRSISYSALSTPDALTLLDHSVNLGHQLKLDTVTEGVESDALLRYVCTTGCEHIQGYIISQPLSLSEFIKFIKDHSPVGVTPIGSIHKARIDYCDWVRRVFGTLYMTGQTLQIVSVDHETTPVGIWLYQSGIDEKIDNYDDILSSYRRSHELSRILINAKSENDNTLLQEMIPDFLDATSEVNRLLHDLYIKECGKLLSASCDGQEAN